MNEKDIALFEAWQEAERRLNYLDEVASALAHIDGAQTLEEIQDEYEATMDIELEKAWAAHYEYDMEAQDEMYLDDVYGRT